MPSVEINPLSLPATTRGLPSLVNSQSPPESSSVKKMLSCESITRSSGDWQPNPASIKRLRPSLRVHDSSARPPSSAKQSLPLCQTNPSGDPNPILLVANIVAL